MRLNKHWLRLLVLTATCALPTVAHAVSVLAPGDVAIVGFNGKDTDQFSLLSLVALDAGVQLRVDVQTAGDITWTVPAGGVAQGTVVVFLNPKDADSPPSTTAGGTLAKNDYNYDSAGDLMAVYQGSNAIYAIETLAGAFTTPTGLSAGAMTMVAHPSSGPARGGRYNAGASRTGYQPQILASLQSTNNWDYYTLDDNAAAYDLNTDPYNTAFTLTPGTVWTSFVTGGFRRRTGPGGNIPLSAGMIGQLQTNNNNAVSENACVATVGASDTITSSQWFSVHFTNTLPAESSISMVSLHVQHQGKTGNGTMQIHASTNRFLTGWYTNGVGASHATSSDIAWSTNEAEAVYDVTSLLNTSALVNQCEFLMLAKLGSTSNVFFDYIWLEAVYTGSGAPAIDNAAGASAITDSSATLNGQLTAGSPNPSVLVVWGDNVGGADTSQWARVEDLGVIGVGPFARAIDGLLANKTYHYRAYASNSLGTAWAATNATFATTPPTVQFTTLTPSALESAGNVVVGLALSATSSLPASIIVSAIPGSASTPADYTFTTTTITIPAGQVSASVALAITEDAIDESDETLTLAFSSPSGANAGAAATFTILDNDNDGPPDVSNGDGPFGVSSNAATLRGELISGGGNPSTVRIHYGQIDGVTTVGNWATNVNLGVLGLGVFTNRVAGLTTNRTYFYRCSASNGNGLVWAPATTNFLTGPPTVAFVTATTSQPETNSPALATIILANPALYGEDVTVSFSASGGSALNGSDYTVASTTATIRAGSSTTNIAVTIINDALNENNETFRLALTAGGKARLGAPLTNTVTIADDDPLPLITFSNAAYFVSEAATSVTIIVSLDPVAGVSAGVDFLTVDGTAVAGSHYAGTNGSLTWGTSGGLTISPRTRAIVVPIIDNALSQGDRQFEFRLSSPNNADFGAGDRVTVTILENDNTPPQVDNGDGAVDVRARMAVLTGAVLAGVPTPQVKVYWGLTDGGTNASDWSRTNTVGAQGGAFSTEVYGLTSNTTYRYRCFASNGGGSDWANAAATFNTGAGLSYYVNDDSLANDVYCTALGTNANLGTAPAAPMASLQTLLDTYNLGPGDTVYVDTGHYALSATVTVGADDVGAAGAGQDMRLRGSPHPSGSILAQTDSGSDVLSLEGLLGNAYVTLQNLQLQGGSRGLYVIGDFEPDLTRGVVVRNCAMTGNSAEGARLQYCADSWLIGCRVVSNGSAGVYLRFCTDSGAVSNTITANGPWGIRSLGSTRPRYAYNAIVGHGGHGIQITSGDLEEILWNTISDNTQDGINLFGSGGTITSNSVNNNGGDGLNVNGDAYSITGNTLIGNASDGLELAADASIRCLHNVMSRNGGYNANFPLANNRVWFEHNTLYGGNGVHFANPQAVTNRHNIVWATGAGAVGIDVPGPRTAGSDAMISDYNCLLATDSANVGNWLAAADNAADPAYSGGWPGFANGGAGFLPWIQTVTAAGVSAVNGALVESSTGNGGGGAPGIDTGGRSWGLYASSNNHAVAYRQATLPVGGSLEIAMDNGYVDNGQSVGFVLRSGNAAGNTADYNAGARFEFLFLGGTNNYLAVDRLGLRNTGVAFTETGLRLALVRGTNDAYALSIINNVSGVTNVLTGFLAGTAGAGVDSLALYNRNAGLGVSHNVFFNSLRITCTASNVAAWHQACIKDGNSLGSDPRFVNPAGEDFHLQSRAGSFHGGQWTADPADSPCIDAAAPDAPYLLEPHYSGFRANLGSDGNTPEASKTYYTGGFYALTLTPSPAAAGSVHVAPVAPLYPSNIPVTIWATVTNAAYSWEAWAGSLSLTAITNTIFVTTNMSLTALFTAAVSNTNGVPGSWLSGYGIPDTQKGANDDTDEDGLANWKEYYANTVPTNPLSRLAFSLAGRSGTRDAVTFWSSTSKQYRVQASTNLPARAWTFWPAATTSNGATGTNPITGTGTLTRVFMDPPSTNRPRFYRIDLNY